MILKILVQIMLMSDARPVIIEKLKYFAVILTSFAPIVWLTDGVMGWYVDNVQFAGFLIFCVTCNLIIGAWYHHRMGTFNFELLLKRNILMITVLIFTYTMLEMLRITAGQNIFTESFRILIKVSSLLYPISKCLKNLYILSNKQFPPAFIMERLYNFEKTGNINDLFPNEPKN